MVSWKEGSLERMEMEGTPRFLGNCVSIPKQGATRQKAKDWFTGESLGSEGGVCQVGEASPRGRQLYSARASRPGKVQPVSMVPEVRANQPYSAVSGKIAYKFPRVQRYL